MPQKDDVSVLITLLLLRVTSLKRMAFPHLAFAPSKCESFGLPLSNFFCSPFPFEKVLLWPWMEASYSCGPCGQMPEEGLPTGHWKHFPSLGFAALPQPDSPEHGSGADVVQLSFSALV